MFPLVVVILPICAHNPVHIETIQQRITIVLKQAVKCNDRDVAWDPGSHMPNF